MASFAEERARAEEGVFRQAAAEILGDLELVLHEPPLSPDPVDFRSYRHLDLRWYERASAELLALGFRHLRDLDGSPVAPRRAPVSVVRVFLNPAGTIAAAVYEAQPRSPGFFLRLLLKILRQWPGTVQVVELTSYTAEGTISSSNQGEHNPFEGPPGNVRRALPRGAKAAEVLRLQQSLLTGQEDRLLSFPDFTELNAAREAHRQRANRWRDEVGVLPAELDRLFTGGNGGQIRPHVERLLAERRARSSPGQGDSAGGGTPPAR